MNIVSGFWTNLAWDNWLYGLLAGFIGGGSGALSSGVGVMVVDPKDFNLDHLSLVFKVMFVTFILAGLTPFFAYLHQSPLPKVKTVTTVETVEKVSSTPPKTVTTKVETTELAPGDVKKT